MSPPTLNTLSLDVFALISQYLDLPTLHNLSLVDRQIHAHVCHTLFRSITVHTASLDADVDRWQAILERHASLGTVRHLRVLGDFSTRIFNPLEAETREDADFTRLTELVSRLVSLSGLNWACEEPLPEAILNLLRQSMPSCRLYLDALQLRSFYDNSFGAYEQSLLSSPNLHSISCCTNDHNADINAFDVLVNLIRFAVKLQTVKIGSGRNLLAKPTTFDGRCGKITWLNPRMPRARLEEVYYSNMLSAKNISTWFGALDDTTLRILDFSGSWFEWSPDIKVYQHLQESYKFANLKQLVMRIPRCEDDECFGLAAQKFVCNLLPLSVLKIDGVISSALLEAMLEVHGTTVRYLGVTPDTGHDIQLNRVYYNLATSNASQLSAIAASCPLLEQLNILIPRYRGDIDEVRLYRALGEFPRLQSLELTLDASDPSFFQNVDELPAWEEEDVPTHPSFDSTDLEFLDEYDSSEGIGPRKGHLRFALINSAIDEGLVRSIFNVISSAKSASSLPLEEVKIVVKPGGWFGDGVSLSSITSLCKTIAQHWHVQRSARDDSRDKVTITSVDKSSPVQPSHNAEHLEYVVDDWATIGPVFRSIWPSSREGDNGPTSWQSDWKSLALAI